MSVEHGDPVIDDGSQATADQLAEMKAYGRQRLVCHLIDLTLDTTTLAVVALLLAKPLDQWLQSWAVFQAAWIRLGAFFLVVAGAQYVVLFPVTLHAGFVLEHTFGLSRQTFWRWFRRDLLKLALTVLSLVTSPLSNAISRHFERQCDRYTLQCTGLYRPYVSAFTKLSRMNKADPQPPWLEVLLFHDHPPIAERLGPAERVAAEESSSQSQTPV